MNRPPRAGLKTEGKLIKSKPKYNFQDIERRVIEARCLQEAGEDEHARAVLQKLAKDLQEHESGE